jgi:hypothetical protein
MNNSAQHLSCGAMVALAQLSYEGKTHREYSQHIGDCTECANIFRGLDAWLKSPPTQLCQKVSQLFALSDCGENDGGGEKPVSVFVSFLRPDLPDGDSLKLYAHLNDCYFCFEMFARNWSDYLRANANTEGEV